MPRFRPATPDDYEAICRLIPDQRELFMVYPSGRYPLDPAQLAKLARERKALTVMEAGGRIAGFANLYGITRGERAFIGNVVIDHALRGQGLGKALVQEMMKRAGDFEVKSVHISVFGTNTPALLLYHRLGFQPYAIEARRAPWGERLALLHMRRDQRPLR